MRAVFIESSEFTAWVGEYLPDETYAALQWELMANPAKGAVMPGCGGLRKVRAPDPHRGQGKRGGTRVIYLHIAEVDQFLMRDIYGKNEKDDLNAQERRILAALADRFRREVLDRVRRAEEGGPS